MITLNSVRQAAAVLPINNTPARMAEARNPPPVGRGGHSSTRAAPQYTHPRIPRPILRQGNTSKAIPDSQFQVNASRVQKPLSLVSNENRTLVSPARCSPVPEDEKQSGTRSSSGHEQFKPNGSVPNFLKKEISRKRSRRRPPSTDSEDEDPFHFDTILSSPPSSKRDVNPRSTLSSSFLRRASIVPVDPSAAPSPHRFSLLREHALEGMIFVQEICDADGRRWSLRVPASGLPEDMVSMLEELERLAFELGQTLPRIVVTCSADSLSSKRADAPAVGSTELLCPPPTTVSAIGSLAKEKSRLVEPESESVCEEEPAKSSSAVISSPSEQSLTCIYLPELAPEFLSGSSTSPVLQPADGFHSKPPAPAPAATSARSSRQRAFFAALRDREPVRSTRSGIARRLAAVRQPVAEVKYKAEANDHAPVPPTPAAQRSRIPMKSALPVLKARSTATATLCARTTPLSSESKSSDPKAVPLPAYVYGGPVVPPGAPPPPPPPPSANPHFLPMRSRKIEIWVGAALSTNGVRCQLPLRPLLHQRLCLRAS